ncbi:SDR family NAD(P)-dependent oxidoreductase [Jiulongibacter sp. NS-SX5]|uniref:SDR family NAD(P)-dependent oxidoreductase n=1 Tax=Jiulongibacter sp. NS-SX5 TaxID=3463854 RepID=UPI004058046D
MNVSILGCGWLGLPLAQYLISKKYKVRGSTTKAEKLQILEEKGIQPFLVDLLEAKPISKEFFESNLLILNVPPGVRRRNVSEHLEELDGLFERMTGNTPEKLLYISSTSIYADLNQEAFEEDADSQSDIYNIEQLIKSKCELLSIQCTILRCGGLMGYGRVPCKYYSGKKDLDLPDKPVNYIHRDDVIGIIDRIIEKGAWGEVFNAVCPQKPMRKEVIADCSKRTSYTEPEYAASLEPVNFKTVSSLKVRNELAYQFKYESPLDFPY